MGQVTTNFRSTALRGRFEAHRFTYNRPVICITYMHVNEEISRTNNLRDGPTSHAEQTRLPSHLENLHLEVGGAVPDGGWCTDQLNRCQPGRPDRRIIRERVTRLSSACTDQWAASEDRTWRVVNRPGSATLSPQSCESRWADRSSVLLGYWAYKLVKFVKRLRTARD